MFFLAFLSIDEEVTSCSSRNEGKGPPEPEFTGDLRGAPNQGRHPRPLEIGAQQKVFKKRRRWRMKKKTFSTRKHQQNCPSI